MTRIKEYIDQEKPVFDYLNYALRLAAWGIGLVVAFQLNRTNPDPFSHVVNLAAIGSCAALGLFAVARFGIMNARIAESLASNIATKWIGRLAGIVVTIWPVLAVTFVGMLICSALMAAIGPR
jgi:nitrate reductase NapE component